MPLDGFFSIPKYKLTYSIMGNRVARRGSVGHHQAGGARSVENSNWQGSEPMSPASALTGAQIIVDYLIQEKVPQVFGLCGHGYIQFIDALYERSDELK